MSLNQYYLNNVAGTLNLLRALHDAGVCKLVLSPIAAVFGHFEMELFDGAHLTRPFDSNGASILMVERLLADAAQA